MHRYTKDQILIVDFFNLMPFLIEYFVASVIINIPIETRTIVPPGAKFSI